MVLVAVEIQHGFSPRTPDTGWKPMLQCSPEVKLLPAIKSLLKGQGPFSGRSALHFAGLN